MSLNDVHASVLLCVGRHYQRHINKLENTMQNMAVVLDACRRVLRAIVKDPIEAITNTKHAPAMHVCASNVDVFYKTLRRKDKLALRLFIRGVDQGRGLLCPTSGAKHLAGALYLKRCKDRTVVDIPS